MDKRTEELTKKSLELIRHELGSVDLSDIQRLEEEMLTDEELFQRANDAEVFFTRHFEKVLKLLTQKQLEYTGTKALDNIQMAFGRGSINGIFIVFDWFTEQLGTSRSRFQKEERPEVGEVL